MIILLYLVYLCLAASGAEFSPGEGDLLKVFVRTSSGEVITSSNTTLYILSDQLTSVQDTASYDGHLTLLTVATSGYLFWCDSSLTCNLTTPSGTTVTISNFLRPGTIVTSVTLLPQSNPNIVYVHSSEMILGEDHRTFTVGTITVGNATYYHRRDIEEKASIIQRTVVSTLATDRYVYYILNHHEGDDGQVRLVRICANDTGVTVSGPLNRTQLVINSYYELRLQCDSSELLALSSAYINGVTGGHIVVSFSDMGEHNVLCGYKENVISSLFTAKYTECLSQGMGYAGRTVNQGFRGMCHIAAMSSECAIGVDNHHSLEVDNPYDGVVLMATNSGMVTLLTTISYGFSYLFTATTDNQVHKYSLSINSSTLTLRESFRVTVGPVTSLAISPDQTVLYALTPKKLVSFSVEQCDEYAHCDQCLGQADSVCGWCALDNKCSTNDSCSNTLWISSNGVSSGDQCPTGSITGNIIISTEQLPYNVTVELINLPIREVDCVFTVGTMSVIRPSYIVDGSVICPITADAGSLITDGDSVVMSLSLRTSKSSDQPFFNITGHITVFDCTSHTMCSSCLSSRHQCSWCPYDGNCTATSMVLCDSALEGNLSTTDSCPQLTPNDNYTLHMNTVQQLVINGKNLLQDGKNYLCVISYKGEEILVEGSWDPVMMTITCDKHNFSVHSATTHSTIMADIKVLWKTVNNYTIDEPVTNIQVTLYQCHLLGSDCTSCLAHAGDNFDCVFCPANNCVFSTSCTSTPFDNCPAPLITTFSPVAGPIDGGTVITIDGSYIGSLQDVVIMIGDENCTPSGDSYVVGRRITCVTNPVHEPQSNSITIVTSNGVNNSSDPFYYKRVMINQIYPGKGPISGGTHINITGSNLNIGNNQNVIVGDKICSVINITSGWITCETEGGDVGVVDITVMVDNFNGTTHYTYIEDPVFASISPVFSFTSGGTGFLVRGERLDIVQSPQLLFTTIISSSSIRQVVMFQSGYGITSGSGIVSAFNIYNIKSNLIAGPYWLSIEYTGACSAENETLLSCEAPAILHNSSVSQLVRLGLVMDGVEELRSLNQTIQVYKDPVFFPLTTDNSSLVFDVGEFVVITINGSDFKFTMDQLKVNIGSDGVCHVLQVTLTTVECVPMEADYPVEQDIPLMVSLGHLNTTVGHVRYTRDGGDRTSGVVFIVVGVIVAIILLLVLIILIYVVSRKRSGFDRFKRRTTALNANVNMYSSQAYSNHHVIPESKLNHDTVNTPPPRAEDVSGDQHVYINREACDLISPEGNYDHQSHAMANGALSGNSETQSQDYDDEKEYLKLVKVDDMTTAVQLLYAYSL